MPRTHFCKTPVKLSITSSSEALGHAQAPRAPLSVRIKADKPKSSKVRRQVLLAGVLRLLGSASDFSRGSRGLPSSLTTSRDVVFCRPFRGMTDTARLLPAPVRTQEHRHEGTGILLKSTPEPLSFKWHLIFAWMIRLACQARCCRRLPCKGPVSVSVLHHQPFLSLALGTPGPLQRHKTGTP